MLFLSFINSESSVTAVIRILFFIFHLFGCTNRSTDVTADRSDTTPSNVVLKIDNKQITFPENCFKNLVKKYSSEPIISECVRETHGLANQIVVENLQEKFFHLLFMWKRRMSGCGYRKWRRGIKSSSIGIEGAETGVLTSARMAVMMMTTMVMMVMMMMMMTVSFFP